MTAPESPTPPRRVASLCRLDVDAAAARLPARPTVGRFSAIANKMLPAAERAPARPVSSARSVSLLFRYEVSMPSQSPPPQGERPGRSSMVQASPIVWPSRRRFSLTVVAAGAAPVGSITRVFTSGCCCLIFCHARLPFRAMASAFTRRGALVFPRRVDGGAAVELRRC